MKTFASIACAAALSLAASTALAHGNETHDTSAVSFPDMSARE